MTSPEMQRRVPERSTENGARQKESITLPDGHTITVTGKGVQTRLRAYALKKDQAQQPNAPTLLLESLFDNEATLKQLVRNGPKKAPILEKAKQQINNFGLQEKIIFLEKAFAVLSNPDP